MHDYLKYNLNSYLQKDKNKNHCFIYVSLFFFILIIITIITFYSYNVITLTAQTFCDTEECELVFYWQTNRPFQYEFFKVNDKKVEIDAINFDDPILDNLNNAYQKVTLKGKEYKGENNEIVTIKIFQNKEKIIKKIGKIIIERET